MGLIEKYDAAIAAVEHEAENFEFQAKQLQARAEAVSCDAMKALANSIRNRECAQALRERRGGLAALYPPDNPKPEAVK